MFLCLPRLPGGTACKNFFSSYRAPRHIRRLTIAVFLIVFRNKTSNPRTRCARWVFDIDLDEVTLRGAARYTFSKRTEGWPVFSPLLLYRRAVCARSLGNFDKFNGCKRAWQVCAWERHGEGRVSLSSPFIIRRKVFFFFFFFCVSSGSGGCVAMATTVVVVVVVAVPSWPSN